MFDFLGTIYQTQWRILAIQQELMFLMFQWTGMTDLDPKRNDVMASITKAQYELNELMFPRSR